MDMSAGEFLEPHEFLVTADVYISSAAAATLRKPTNQRRKLDKRDSLKPISGHPDDVKVKEKTSWLTLTKTNTGGGHFRTAVCKLSEDGDRCLFFIYVDETVFFRGIHIHLLHQCDIRLTDHSLFQRKDCIGIYCTAHNRWPSSVPPEPLYLQFANPDVCNTWLNLLRSYAIPDVYAGRFLGGLFRTWRQVELNVLQGRNLGIDKIPDAFKEEGANDQDDEQQADMEILCEVHLNGTQCGRTTTKKGGNSPDWHEQFVFTDLPAFKSWEKPMELHIWREKKGIKTAMLGTVQITLNNFRRGDIVEGWFPMLGYGAFVNDVQIGELRLKLRIDEEIILPLSAYADLLNTFNSRNFLDWMNDFESKLKLKTVSINLMSIAIARNVVIEQVQELALREVDGTNLHSQQTLFRGNTTLTKVMELCMVWYGKAFLEASIGAVLRKLYAEKVGIEVDPVRSGKGVKDIERNVDQLLHWCKEFWLQIDGAKAKCPQEMRRLFETIRKVVERRYGSQEHNPNYNPDLPHQSVSAFCFLRFIVPAILHPHLFGLCPGLPIAPVQRSLTLIAKVIQSLANLNSSVQKEEFMRGIKEFLVEKRRDMVTYIQFVSTPLPPHEATLIDNGLETTNERYERLQIMNILRRRVTQMPDLQRETITFLPHFVDVPRHLAIITSAVIRNSKDFYSKFNDQRAPGDKPLAEFCSKCFKVEEYALLRVSQLETQRVSGSRRASTVKNKSTVVITADHLVRSSSTTSSQRRRKSERPSTAPSPSEVGFNRHRSLAEDASNNSQQIADIRGTRGEGRVGAHLKSPSTDSVPLAQTKTSLKTMADSRTIDTDISDDAGKRKKGLFRGILRI
ncbi:hypothetical protein AX16_009559 [Volvariella volvacea WC 439]|nr:hypothetical protein AX16_009559 [Volvariella volvacea WC 439]